MCEEDTTSRRKFYVVWNPNRGNPRVRYWTLSAATLEADRLARENPGHNFYILEALRRHHTVKPIIVEHLK